MELHWSWHYGDGSGGSTTLEILAAWSGTSVVGFHGQGHRFIGQFGNRLRLRERPTDGERAPNNPNAAALLPGMRLQFRRVDGHHAVIHQDCIALLDMAVRAAVHR
jgi:hypothetical protein